MEFTDRAFRDALGAFPTGVAIITAEVDDVLLGTTVSSFNSVSLSPPLILFSLARSALALPLWLKATHFGVTILRESQSELSTRFARSGTDKWSGITPNRGKSGVPLLTDGLACFECATHAIHDGGDHEIIVGRVLSFEVGKTAPLVFHSGRYRQLRSETPIETPPDIDVWLHAW